MNYDRLFRPSGIPHSEAMKALQGLAMGGVTTLTQSAFRIRNDDGSETTATWLQAINTDGTVAVTTTFRVRFNIAGAGGSGMALVGRLQYNKGGAGWNAVTTSSSVIKAVNSANITHGEATTEQMAQAGSFLAGEVSEDGTANLDAGGNIGPSQDTEFEYVIQIVAGDVVHDDTIQLRVINDASELNGGYTQTPTITVSEVAAAVPIRSMVGVGL